jgi:MFS family permease
MLLNMTAVSQTPGSEPSRLWNRGFLALMATQVAGATNDNLLKAILLTAVAASGVWEGVLGPGGTGWVSFMLTAPFVILLGYAGQLADRLPKNRITVATRLAEVPIAALALIGFMLDSPWIVIVAFLLLSSESAFFSPSKYGVIKEYVGESQLSRANGVINGSTNVAIIGGSVLGGYLLQTGMMWAGVVLVAMAVAGLVASLFMPYTAPVNPGLPWSWDPTKSYRASIQSMRATACDEHGRSALWIAVLAWASFFMIAILVLAVVPEYKEPLGLNETQTGGLLAALGVGIGAGCVGAAVLSGKNIKLWFVPIGGVLMGAVMIGLGFVPIEHLPTGLAHSVEENDAMVAVNVERLPYWWLFGTLVVAGIFAGFYIVPLQALQQALAADEFRARVLGTANALSFLLMAIASLFYAIVVGQGWLTPQQVLMLCGGGMLVLVGWLIRRRQTFSLV